MVKCLPAIRETQVPWIGNIPWRRKCQPTLVLLPGKSHERRSLVGYSLWGHKELDMAEWLHFTHSDVLDRLCCKNSYISWLQPLPLWSCLSELSEMLCPRFEVLRISTKYSIILNVQVVHFSFSWEQAGLRIGSTLLAAWSQPASLKYMQVFSTIQTILKELWTPRAPN